MHFERKLQLATDLYQLSMGNVYLAEDKANEIAVFDMFTRRNPFNGGYTIFAGLEQVIEYIQKLKFEEEDIQLLKKNHPDFTEDFLNYLLNFKFEGQIDAIPEGTVFFPYEPILRVKAPLIQAQLIETTMLAIINHQTLIATKAARICEEAGDDPVMEFGLRRAHGTEAGYFGARAAVIGGCVGTSVVETEELLGRPSMGTMAHSYVLSFDDEKEAFEKYIQHSPSSATLLVDTYDTLDIGIPNAIEVFKKALAEDKIKGTYGIRIDSGDLAYLSAEARRMLDEAGLKDAKIVASSDLDEYLIKDLRAQGAKIDSWGIGTKLITAYDWPALGGVYKLVEIDGKPRIKISNDPWKITNPGFKKIIRIYGKSNDMALADLLMLDHETIDESAPLTIFHPVHTWKQREIKDFYIKELLQPIFKKGELVYDQPELESIVAHREKEMATLWPTFKRMINPHVYHVDLSQELWDLRHNLLPKGSE